MAYLDNFSHVDEMIEDRSGVPFSADLSREYTRKFLVRVTDKTYGPVLICSHPTLPRPYDPYITADGDEFDLLALCVKIEPKQDKNDWKHWEITYTYSTNVPRNGQQLDLTGFPGGQGGPGGGGGSAQNNPEMEPPEIEWDFEVVQTYPQYDLLGTPYTNSAGQPFPNPYGVETAHPVLVLTRNEMNFNRENAADYAFSLNSKPLLGAPVETAQCYPPKAKVMFKGPLRYFRVTYKIRFINTHLDFNIAEPGQQVFQPRWQPNMLDSGFAYRDDATGKLRSFKDDEGRTLSGPSLLNGLGQKAEVKRHRNGLMLPVPVYMEFSAYKLRDLNRLLKYGTNRIAVV